MELVPKAEFSIVTRASKAWIPELIAAAGPEVTETYIDFFTATIRNRNTRAAYARACWQFFDWCKAHGLELTSVRPFHVAAWIEDFPGSKPTVKQKLAAVRMLYDFLVVRLKPGGRFAESDVVVWGRVPAENNLSLLTLNSWRREALPTGYIVIETVQGLR